MRHAPWPRLVVASGNPGKLRELRELLAGFATRLVPQTELGVPSPPETAGTLTFEAGPISGAYTVVGSLPTPSWIGTVNQGGASGSTGIQMGGTALASAAAEARYQLVQMGSKHLNIPADQLRTDNGTVISKTDATKKVTYGELIGGRYFDTQLEWNKQIGNALFVKGTGVRKPVSEHKVIGTSPARQ